MSEYQFWIEVGILLATIVAIVYGPVKAVQITRNADNRREDRARKYQILSDLMKTRQARIDPIHVAALNLIELEFYECDSIRKAFREYSRHLNSHFPKEKEALDRHSEEGDALFADLLREIANELGFNFDKADLQRLGYQPQGLSAHNDNSMVNAHLLREVLEGRRPLQISSFIQNNEVFPPPPTKTVREDKTNE